MSRWVVDTSPLIFLAKLDRLELLRPRAVVGTLGLLLSARLRGEIPSLHAEIDRLRAAGFRMSEHLVTAALEASGEL
jgi:predicted nucleic acid-binding protein